MVETRFFPELRLSWPENLLIARDAREEDAIAVVSVSESGVRDEITRAGLRARVRAVAAGLSSFGLEEGDRVAAIARNTLDTLIACLATTSLGATWSSLALDMGPDAALARLTRLAPKLLFFHPSTCHAGATIHVPIKAIAEKLLTAKAVVNLAAPDNAGSCPEDAFEIATTTLRQIEADGRTKGFGTQWRRFAFDHPLFVLFSSGTTGAPKGIVHGHGGTLVEHLKEHRLHCDLGPRDALCFLTSTGWMMWNWAVSALAAGSRVVLYDGSVSHPSPDALLQCIARENVTVFGVSPAYLRYLLDAGVTGTHDLLGRVRMILSTGSVLPRELHRWAKDRLARAPVESISGGTDILGCFVLASPWSPTFEGESSSIGLGMDVRAVSPSGQSADACGELVCTTPFPSRPVSFLDDPGGTKMHQTYYAQHPGAWTHGDLVALTERGTARVLGRCDGVLNIRGIRIGPSEIYDVLGAAIPQVAQAMAVDADAPDEPGGKQLVLFVVLDSGATLDRTLALRIKKALRERASAAHVPSSIVAVEELPMTHNQKLSESAMQDALNGRPVRNLAALRNPGSIQKAMDALRATESRSRHEP